MNLKSKQATTGLTILIVVAILFVLNYLVGGVGFGNLRLDLTEDKLYTLSQGTKNIINGIQDDKPVTIRFYVTSEDRVMPPILKTYARTVQDLLLEFEKQGAGKIVLEKVAPNPNTEEEDKAKEDEVQGMTVNSEGDNIYLGLAIQCLQQKEVLPFLNPNEETALEYNLARAISKVSKDRKTIIGVMSAMPIQGSPMMPFMRQQGGHQEPWIIVQRLRMDYEVREVPFNTDKIDSDISVLVVVHPATITEQTEYAIDQYVLGGGQLVAFVDPQCWIAQAYSGQQNPMMGGQPNVINPSSELKNLFKAWGVGFDTGQVVADMSYLAVMQGRRNPTALGLPEAAINKGNRITGELKSILMMSAGQLNVEKLDGVKSEILLESSENSEMIDTAAAEKLRTQGLTSFNPSGRKKILGVQLTGKFKTAFPNGKPKSPADEAKKEAGGAQTDASAPKTNEAAKPAPEAAKAPAATITTPPVAAPPATPAAATAEKNDQSSVVPGKVSATEAKPEEKKDDGSLKESKGEPTVLLFSDSDMMFDAFCVQQDRMTGMTIAFNSNLPMFLNAVEVLAGGGDLLSVRSRASTQRPFTKLDEMRDSVERKYRPRLVDLEQKQQKIVQDLAEKKTKQGQGGILLLDPAKDKEVKQLIENQTKINKEIRELKKEVNRDVDHTLNWLTVLNILAVPLLVIGAGSLLAIRRRVATAAR